MPSVCALAFCPNGVLEGGEACDDQTLTGCAADCQSVRAGWSCSLQGVISVCEAKQVGDGITAGTEECDDGNTSDKDGCSSAGSVEEGWACSEDSASKSTCTAVCGDGLRVGDEACDDKNTVSFDGCSGQCSKLESGFACKSKKDGGRHTED
jgi:cysteine-rich repeat protein